MLRLAPAVSPNKVVVVPPSWTRIPTFTSPRHQIVTRKSPNFLSLCCSNVDADNSILAKPLESEINSSPEGMVLFVNINKGNGTSVTFGVTLWPHRMEVFSLAVKSIEMRELRIDMVEKEIGKLESAIQEYLKARGIKPCYADYLYRRMVYLHMVRRSSRWCCGD